MTFVRQIPSTWVVHRRGTLFPSAQGAIARRQINKDCAGIFELYATRTHSRDWRDGTWDARSTSGYGQALPYSAIYPKASICVHADTVGRWLKLDKQALALEKPGRKVGSGRRLSVAQEQQIKAMLIDKTPDQLKMAYALWTREAVRELIRDRCGLTLAIRTIGDYLKRWGMTPQKLQKRAYEQRTPEVKAWLKDRYPALQAQVKHDDA